MYLQLDRLTKIFPARDSGAEVRAVDDVNLSIAEGQFVTLLGPSGCGKTTTLRLIAGFEFPSVGRIVLDGQDIADQPPNRRDMAMVFQSYAIFPHLTVFENIAYGLRIRKIGGQELQRQVGQALELTELFGLENRQPNQLSGGQQQRVALARALVMQPKVLLFDEPLSNLDAKLRVQMRGEIRRIQQELGITSVYVTHDQDEAMVLSDLVVVMNQGRLEQVGTPPEIYRQPSNRFVADFIGRANFLPVSVAETAGDKLLLRMGSGDTLTLPAMGMKAPMTPASEAKALLLVRPESIRLHGSQQPETVKGSVVSRSYLGAVAEYEITAFGTTLAAVQYNPGEAELLNPGATIYLELLKENLYLLPDA